MSFSNLMRQQILKHVFTEEVLPRAYSFFLGVSRTPPGGDGADILEPAPETGYTRQAIAGTDWSVPSTVEPVFAANLVEVNFPATTDWWSGIHSVSYITLFNVDGLYLGYCELARPRILLSGDVLHFSAGSIQFGLVE